LPQSPIYVPLLPDEAQWALGQLHPVGELPFGILMDEGFDGETYVNVFDGGPTADSRVALLKTVARRHACGVPSAAARAEPRRKAPAGSWWPMARARGLSRHCCCPVGQGTAAWRWPPTMPRCWAWPMAELASRLWGARLDLPAAGAEATP
jgi:hypothetical protein